MGDGGARRAPALAGLVVLLLAGGLADRAGRPAVGTAVEAGGTGPLAPPDTALSSTWYCAAGTAAAGGPADSIIVVANPGARRVTGTLRLVAGVAPGATPVPPVDVPIAVRPYSNIAVRAGDRLAAEYAAAIVDLDGGGVVAEQVVTGPLGEDATPCASAASAQWYFAAGTTVREARLLLALFNPFPDDAIADLSFSTEQGRSAPADYQGVVVPGRSLVVVDIGERVRRRQALATAVATRRGRLVASKIQLVDGPGRRGLALALGAPSAGELWQFADGVVQDGVSERLHLYNPSGREARVDLSLALDQGAAEPFELTVPPRDRITVNLHEESRVPKSVGHSLVAQSLNGVPVVVEQAIDSASPAPRSGITELLGARRPARRWVFASGSATEEIDEWVVVANFEPRPVRVTLTALAAGQALPVESAQSVDVGPNRRLAVRLGDHLRRPDLPLVVSATGPVVAVRALYRVATPGLAWTLGIPLREG